MHKDVQDSIGFLSYVLGRDAGSLTGISQYSYVIMKLLAPWQIPPLRSEYDVTCISECCMVCVG